MHPFFQTRADAWIFDPSMLNEGTGKVDVSVFNNGGQLPGSYPVDIVLNGKVIDSREMVFSNHTGDSLLKTCLTSSLLDRYGIKIHDYPALFSPSPDKAENGEQCANINAIPQASVVFNFYQRRLLLTIPQAALRTAVSGIAPAELWDDGIPAFLMNYGADISRNESRGVRSSAAESRYVQLEPGVNIGPWRFRNMTTWQQHGVEKGKWQTVWNYAERGFSQIKSRLTVGDHYSPSDVFEGVPFRGIMLKTDEDMLPWSEKEFAPVVRGIARTQARIEVKRSGYVIYTINVPAGPFIIRDLPAVTSGEDLYVTVYETGGQQHFVIPFSRPAIALREGYFKYDLMAGRYRPAITGLELPYVGQMSFMYGLPEGMTVFGGFQGASHYQAASQGLGIALDRLGAVSVDGTLERGLKRGQEKKTAHALRIRYSKNLGATNTALYLTANRYSASGYSGMAGVLDSYWQGQDAASHHPPARKSRMGLTLSQPLQSWGYLSLAYSRENFWRSEVNVNEYSVTWGSGYRNVSWAISGTQRRASATDSERHVDQQVSFWLSMPLESMLGKSTRISYQTQRSSEGHVYNELGLSGENSERQLGWDVRQQITSGSQVKTRSNSLVNLSWRGGYGQLRGSYGYSSNSRQINAGIAGGLLIHQHGITLSQPLGNTVALIEVPGAAGIDVKGRTGVMTDFRGYTTLGYLSPYQENTVALKQASFRDDLEILTTDIKVVPTGGAVVPARFRTRVGGKALMSITYKNGIPVPFGSLATPAGEGENNTTSGIVGEKGEVYLSGLRDEGILQIHTGLSNTCLVHYRLPKVKGPAGTYFLKSVCR